MQSNMFMSHTHQIFYHFKLPPHHVSFSNFAIYTFQTHKLSDFATKGYTNISQVIFHSVGKVSTLSLATALEMQLHDIHPLIFKVFSPSRNRPEKKKLLRNAFCSIHTGHRVLCKHIPLQWL